VIGASTRTSTIHAKLRLHCLERRVGDFEGAADVGFGVRRRQEPVVVWVQVPPQPAAAAQKTLFISKPLSF